MSIDTDVLKQKTGTVDSQQSAPACPLCGDVASRPSWLDQVVYAEREFRYLECLSCQSLYCHPMPDEELLARMYGPNYAGDVAADASVSDPKEPEQVIRKLQAQAPGTFLDFGCGDGRLLSAAMKHGWKAIGVEYDEAVARNTSEKTGAEVVPVSEAGDFLAECADVLHLGDVIEHLPDLPRQTPSILRLLKPGGLLLAQGPLEANANLFTYGVRLSRALRPRRPVAMAPYHVLLASARGQREFFKRFGLQEIEYRVHEAAWPAPATLPLRNWLKVRPAGMFLLRRLSQGISALRPGRWGNRYFYAGRLGEGE